MKPLPRRRATPWPTRLLSLLLCCSLLGTFPGHRALALEATPAPEETVLPLEEALPTTSPMPSLSLDFSPTPEASAAPQGEAGSLLRLGGHETYLSGYEDGTFRPKNAMRRSEVAVMLYSLLEAAPPDGEAAFPDVADSAWYAQGVNALSALGILGGYPDGSFQPHRTVTRGEFFTMLARCFPPKTGDMPFTDITEAHWAYDSIVTGYQSGWLDGYEDGTLRPGRTITRAEAVKVMNSALERRDQDFSLSPRLPFPDNPPGTWYYQEVLEAAQPNSLPTPPEETPTPSPTPSPTAAPSGELLRVEATGGLNLRSGPGSSYPVLQVLPDQAVVTLLDKSDPLWYQVRSSQGTTGYASAQYLRPFTPGPVHGVSLSASQLTLAQYQSARLDGTAQSGLASMTWTSSDPQVARVAYTLPLGSDTTQAAFIYGNAPGTAVLTFTGPDGRETASCTVTVTQPQPVRAAYASENLAMLGVPFDLLALTDPSKSAVRFTITQGPATGSYETTSYTQETQASSRGLPDNQVRIFSRSVTFHAAGMYTLRAYSQTGDSWSQGYNEFQVMVLGQAMDSTVTADIPRRISTRGIGLIAQFEGMVREVDVDPVIAGYPTVGYGYVVNTNTLFYNNVTDQEAYGMLEETVNEGYYAQAVESFRSSYSMKMNQDQFDGLTSFAYNLGGHAITTEYGTFRVMANAVVPPNASPSQPYAGTLNIGDAPVYASPASSAQVVSTLSQGTAVSVIGYTGDTASREFWYQIRSGSATGWVRTGLVSLQGDLTHDLTYLDAKTFAGNLLLWHKSGGVCVVGLLYRRLAEAKLITHSDYAQALHSSPYFHKNTYSFPYPPCCQQYEE